MRRKKLFLNTGTAILNQLVTLVCGLILPQLIIEHYGSATNGLLASISQFLAFFSMMEMGVGAVVRSALYKPLAENDSDTVSRVLISSRRFFRRIGAMLCLYALGLMVFFPLKVDHSLGYLSTGILVGALAFNAVSMYMLGIIYQQLLNADQRSYVQIASNIIVVVLNTVFSVVLIRLDASIVTVKLVAAAVFLVRPLFLKWYVDRHYRLNLKLTLNEEPLKQKWNGLAQHIAQYILVHADTVILTLMSTLENVSIYYVYHLVTNGLEQLLRVTTVGIQALLGNMYVKGEKEQLSRTFSAFEWIIHTFVVLIYSMAGVLILPFVSIYTRNVRDVNYAVPLFAVLIVSANAVLCLRIPYNIMVQAAGHFKQTQASAIIEASMNVVISVLLVHRFGLVGVAVGTLAAMLYRTCYLAWYLRSTILNRPFRHFILHLAVDVIMVGGIVAATRWISLGSTSWSSWVFMALKTAAVALPIIAVINLAFYRDLVKDSFKLLFGKIQTTEANNTDQAEVSGQKLPGTGTEEGE